MILRVFTAVFLVLAAPAAAGQLLTNVNEADGGKTAIAYEFTKCRKPQAPKVAVQKEGKIKARHLAHSRAVRQYNDHVTAVNEYMQCLSDEAGRDLEAYYKTVSDALAAEQNSQMRLLDDLREDLETNRL